MKKKLKGGIETILAVIILTGIVVALILVSVKPTADGASALTQKVTGKMSGLSTTIEANEAEKQGTLTKRFEYVS